LNTLGTFFFISPFNILGVCLSAILPRKNDFFLNLVIVVEKEK